MNPFLLASFIDALPGWVIPTVVMVAIFVIVFVKIFTEFIQDL